MDNIAQLRQENEELKTKLSLALTYLDDKTAKEILFGDNLEDLTDEHIHTRF